MRRGALAAVVLAACLATLGLHEPGGEAARQLAAASVIAGEGGDLERATRDIGLGFPALLAPATLVADGAAAVLLALIATAGFLLAAGLARRVVPEPYATAGVALVALSAPALALSTVALPELTAATLLTAATVLVLRAREVPRMRVAVPAAALIAALPWLDVPLLMPGLPLLYVLVRDLARRGRGLVALVAVEVVAGSLITWVSVNDAIYGGLTPGRGWSPEFDRLARIASLLLDRDAGLLRWAPVLALAGAGAFALWRARRDRVSRAVPERADAERVAAVCLLVCATQFLVAVTGTTPPDGAWFPGRTLAPALPLAAVLVAWGLRRAPRTGAVLGAIGVGATGWLLIGREPLHPPDTSAPWGPLDAAFPVYGVGSAWADAVGAGLAAAAILLLVGEWRAWRTPAATS